jgi:hypothetical protein
MLLDPNERMPTDRNCSIGKERYLTDRWKTWFAIVLLSDYLWGREGQRLPAPALGVSGIMAFSAPSKFTDLWRLVKYVADAPLRYQRIFYARWRFGTSLLRT